MARGSLSLPQVTLPTSQARGFLETKRKDTWWLFPTITLIYFLSFIVYSTWAAFQGAHYWYEGPEAAYKSQYLSPMYSPVIWTDPAQPGSAPIDHAIMGAWPDWLPKLLFGFMPITPALFILWAPGGFRFTCYYYRGAYYKAFWGDPPNCAVGEPRKSYWGERWAPLVLMNIHRYFLYLALLFILILSYDAIISYIFINRTDGSHHFGIGLGSIIITLNAMFLGFYTFGCHSLRHLVGGKKDCIGSGGARKKSYDCVSCLNRWHMQWAWISLFWVGFTDLYIRMCSMGIWSDWRII